MRQEISLRTPDPLSAFWEGLGTRLVSEPMQTVVLACSHIHPHTIGISIIRDYTTFTNPIHKQNIINSTWSCYPTHNVKAHLHRHMLCTNTYTRHAMYRHLHQTCHVQTRRLQLSTEGESSGNWALIDYCHYLPTHGPYELTGFTE